VTADRAFSLGGPTPGTGRVPRWHELRTCAAGVGRGHVGRPGAPQPAADRMPCQGRPSTTSRTVSRWRHDLGDHFADRRRPSACRAAGVQRPRPRSRQRPSTAGMVPAPAELGHFFRATAGLPVRAGTFVGRGWDMSNSGSVTVVYGRGGTQKSSNSENPSEFMNGRSVGPLISRQKACSGWPSLPMVAANRDPARPARARGQGHLGESCRAAPCCRRGAWGRGQPR